MTTEAKTKDEKLPTVFWHGGANQYVSKIGYKVYERNGQKVRDRDFQLLGNDYAEAMAKAIQIAKSWKWTVNYFKTTDRLKGQKPVWLPKEQTAAYQAAERGGIDEVYRTGVVLNVGEHDGTPHYRSLDEQLAERKRSRITLKQAKEIFAAHYKSRIGLAGGKGIKLYTYMRVNTEIGLAFRFIDQNILLTELTKSDMETMVNKWMALPNGISIRTAVNYCKSFKQMIDWLADEDTVDFVKPRGTDRVFRFKNFNPIHIAPYTNDELKAIFAVLPERYRMFIQLAINCGYYQIDLATLRHEHLVMFEDGKEMLVGNVQSFEGDLYIRRRRQKTMHQNEFETLCYVWPENLELMRKHAAPFNNPHGLVFLNDEGLPLIHSNSNNITERFTHYKRDVKLNRNLQFKQFRKTGATWIENNPKYGDRAARMYNAHTMAGELKRYVAQSYAPLTAALKDWREELVAAGVVRGLDNPIRAA